MVSLDTGSWNTAKSTGQINKTAAEAWGIKYLESGQIVLKENLTFETFTDTFFDFNGPYGQSRRKGQIHQNATIYRRKQES